MIIRSNKPKQGETKMKHTIESLQNAVGNMGKVVSVDNEDQDFNMEPDDYSLMTLSFDRLNDLNKLQSDVNKVLGLSDTIGTIYR